MILKGGLESRMTSQKKFDAQSFRETKAQGPIVVEQIVPFTNDFLEP